MKKESIWQDNIKSELQEIGWEGDVDWTNLSHCGEKV